MVVLTLAGQRKDKLAAAASNRAGPVPDGPSLVQGAGFTDTQRVAETEPELLSGQRDRQLLAGGLRNAGRIDRNDDRGSTPLIWTPAAPVANSRICPLCVSVHP